MNKGIGCIASEVEKLTRVIPNGFWFCDCEDCKKLEVTCKESLQVHVPAPVFGQCFSQEPRYEWFSEEVRFA